MQPAGPLSGAQTRLLLSCYTSRIQNGRVRSSRSVGRHYRWDAQSDLIRSYCVGIAARTCRRTRLPETSAPLNKVAETWSRVAALDALHGIMDHCGFGAARGSDLRSHLVLRDRVHRALGGVQQRRRRRHDSAGTHIAAVAWGRTRRIGQCSAPALATGRRQTPRLTRSDAAAHRSRARRPFICATGRLRTRTDTSI
jgi:hypothetical protein